MCFLAISRSLEQFLLTQVITFHIWCLIKESHSDYFLKEAETPFVSPCSRIGSDRHRLHKAQNSKGRKGCPVRPLTHHPASPVPLPVFIPYAGCQVGNLLLVSLSLKLCWNHQNMRPTDLSQIAEPEKQSLFRKSRCLRSMVGLYWKWHTSMVESGPDETSACGSWVICFFVNFWGWGWTSR